MKNYFKILMLFFLFTNYVIAQDHESIWESEFNFGDDFALTTFLKVNSSSNEFIILKMQIKDYLEGLKQN